MSKVNVWRRIGFAISFLIVAGVAARVSYGHIREVAILGHQPADIAALLPLAVDGLMLIATLAISQDKAAGRHPRGWARFGFWFGAVLSIAANVAATTAFYTDVLSIGVAAAAPILLLISVEIVARPGKPKLTSATELTAEMAEVPVSPAPAGSGKRQPYGPRNGEQYSDRHGRRITRGK